MQEEKKNAAKITTWHSLPAQLEFTITDLFLTGYVARSVD
jgi:hypothetical protein